VAERRRGDGGWQWRLELNALVLEGVGELKSVGEKGRWWPGVLRGLYRGLGERQGGVTTGG
jgi:hypothetical protein